VPSSMIGHLTEWMSTQTSAGLAGWPAAGTPPPGAEKFELIISWATWIATVLCGLGFVVIGTRLTLSIRRGETGEHLTRLGAAAAGVVIVGAAVNIVNALL